ncbi:MULTISPECIES: hypothetical protein [Metallosphaera]|uniref:Lipoate--protein ligase n=2 Tax=Metallosphaera TaxID=41980 RepID=A0A0K1SIY0_9CREN|nr:MULTISPECIES: hypothetical protein [Metallosphaera]AKV74503.1 hypothetical protein MsedA_1527 [Metallosphaera sedula]AKV76742.1 hypothetical protein MsedB_1529 [Metallosphaera sedula]AKV78993.1 hypothetical protein MsedC_1527 [Metallosphaera sedula]AKV81238.1 hypothetical protein MsedD_1528 [Metallosphaera sedula]AKV83478.1 hypothetical protein MsedE_1533 [Metallosphaera sedula]
MICEKIFRSRAGKTIVLRVTEGRVEITGDFFGSEEDLEKLERDLSNLRSSDARILGVDNDELLEKVKECFSRT